ncbi:MAG TPA: hypothetical protein VLS45_04745 [Methylomicrobium sp.]|nr:hypothetical protein [Methylomicrobium sp.]
MLGTRRNTGESERPVTTGLRACRPAKKSVAEAATIASVVKQASSGGLRIAKTVIVAQS